MKNNLLFVIIVSAALTSCGSILDGLSSMYGGGYGGGYDPYAGFWNSPAATTVPASLNPTTAADAAAKQGISNVTSGYWDNVGKAGQQVQNTIDAVAKDVWANPEKYQGTPVEGSNSGSGTASSGTVAGSRSSSSSSGHQCRLCNGTGRKISLIHPANNTQTKWCTECKKTVGTGHSHTTCDLCGGDGWIE